MLVLSRKLNEKIYIGESIVVTVVSIDKGVVKIGIDAPKSYHIRRSELPPNNTPKKDTKNEN